MACKVLKGVYTLYRNFYWFIYYRQTIKSRKKPLAVAKPEVTNASNTRRGRTMKYFSCCNHVCCQLFLAVVDRLPIVHRKKKNWAMFHIWFGSYCVGFRLFYPLFEVIFSAINSTSQILYCSQIRSLSFLFTSTEAHAKYPNVDKRSRKCQFWLVFTDQRFVPKICQLGVSDNTSCRSQLHDIIAFWFRFQVPLSCGVMCGQNFYTSEMCENSSSTFVWKFQGTFVRRVVKDFVPEVALRLE